MRKYNEMIRSCLLHLSLIVLNNYYLHNNIKLRCTSAFIYVLFYELITLDRISFTISCLLIVLHLYTLISPESVSTCTILCFLNSCIWWSHSTLSFKILPLMIIYFILLSYKIFFRVIYMICLNFFSIVHKLLILFKTLYSNLVFLPSFIILMSSSF